ncbi:MAG: dipeptidase [Saprospiraceae bacterium]|nr:dipeptidase [Saprospiraceae bacterium]
MRYSLFFLCCLSAFSLAAQKENSDLYLQRAQRILKKTPVIDTHIDFPYSLVERQEWYTPGYTALALRHPGGDFDHERAKAGGLYGAFMSIYIPASYQKMAPGASKALADSLIDMVHAIAREYPDKFALAFRSTDILKNFKKGIVSLPMGMENGAPIQTLADVAYFHQRGIRYVTLTHSRDNQISDSSYDTLHTHGGLSDYGREVVREMNRVGILVDVSHLSDDAIRDVLDVATRPVIATHSACRHFTPGMERNLSDELIRAIALQHGVIQVPFSHYFLSTHAREVFFQSEKEMKERGLDEHSPEARQFMRESLGRSGISVRDVADHIDHIKKLVGVDYIGLGGDFDGVGQALPPDLADVSMYPNLIAELLRRGYSRQDIQKICYQNMLRVWRASE